MRFSILFIFLSMVLVTSAAAAKDSFYPYINKVEEYFNKLESLDSNFTQINGDGQIYEGRFYLSAPGKFRLDYTFPASLLLISDGKTIIQFDRETKDANYIDLDSTPAHLIMRKNLKLCGKDIEVSNIDRKENKFYMSIIKRRDSGFGKMVLAFNVQPFTLLGWTVFDAEGNQTEVQLSNVQIGRKIDQKLFEFRK